MIIPGQLLNIPLPDIAGTLAGSVGPLKILCIMRRLMRKLDLMNRRGMEAGIRSKLKIRNLLAYATTLRNSYIIKKRSTSSRQIRPIFDCVSLIQRQLPNSQCFGDCITSLELEKVFEFSNIKKEVRFENVISFWKQRSVRKISEGSHGEIYQFRNIDGVKRIFKCMTINGQPSIDSLNNPLLNAVPDIISSKCLSDLNEGQIFATPNFSTIYNICLVRDHFPGFMMRAWEDYENSSSRLKDPVEHIRPDCCSDYLTIESSFCGEPLTPKLFQNAWLGVSIMSQIVSALAVAEAAYNFEHRNLHLGNILVQNTTALSLKYTLHNQHFSIETIGCHIFIIDFTLSRICNDQRAYWVELEEMAQRNSSLEEPIENIWLNHRNVCKIMTEYSKKRWDKYMPITNIIWVKHMNEVILDFVEKNNPLLTETVLLQEDCNQMTAFRLLEKWNNCILHHLSATDLLKDVILKDNPIVSVCK